MSTQIEITQNIINYLFTNGYRSDPVIDELVKETNALGSIAQMQIAPEQGQFLEMIVRLINAKNCLEIGRFTGLSALCIAKGLAAGGKVMTIDNSREFLAVAEKYWKKKGVKNKIESITGEGVEVLQSLTMFDGTFIKRPKLYLNFLKLPKAF